jgi:spermidine synthase
MLVDVVKQFYPNTTRGFDDERVRVFVQDGLKYIRKCEEKYDLIIVDSTDPFGPGEVFFTKEFYGNCYKALKSDGILVNQHEGVFYEHFAKAVQKAHKNIFHSFPVCKIYQAHVPTYPSGHWLFGFASKKYHPLRDLREEYWNGLDIKTRYYNTNLHKGAFYLPNYVTELLKDVE